MGKTNVKKWTAAEWIKNAVWLQNIEHISLLYSTLLLPLIFGFLVLTNEWENLKSEWNNHEQTHTRTQKNSADYKYVVCVTSIIISFLFSFVDVFNKSKSKKKTNIKEFITALCVRYGNFERSFVCAFMRSHKMKLIVKIQNPFTYKSHWLSQWQFNVCKQSYV